MTEAIHLGDNDPERKTQAEVLLNAYSRELERRRLAAGAQGLLLSTHGTTISALRGITLTFRHHGQTTITLRKMTMTTTSFITLALHLRERGVHRLSDRSRQITLTDSPHHELLRILHLIFRKLQSSESQLIRLRKR